MWWRQSRRSVRRRALQERGRAREAGGQGDRRPCPRCGRAQVRRSRRRSPWEWLLRAFCLYPYRCESCKHRFLRFSLRGR
jgi:hypothetical protein